MNNIKKYDYLTSLRGIAALWVVFYHIAEYVTVYTPWWLTTVLQKGYLAVDFFFLLSGFILTMNYSSRFTVISLSVYRIFLIKRIARIYPLHLFVLIGYLLVPLAYIITSKSMPEGDRYSSINYIYQLLLVNNWGVTQTLSWNIPAWSISAEWAAYLLFPVFVIISNKVKEVLIPPSIILLCAVIYYTFSAMGYDSLGHNIQKLGIFRCLIEFFIGGLIYKYIEKYSLVKWYPYFLTLCLIIGVAVVFNLISEVVFAPVGLVFCLIAFVSMHSSKIVSSLRFSPLMLLGEISYSIYLIHYLVKDLFKLLFLRTDVAEPWWIISYVISVLLVSFLTYKLIEIPARKVITSIAVRKYSMEAKAV